MCSPRRCRWPKTCRRNSRSSASFSSSLFLLITDNFPLTALNERPKSAVNRPSSFVTPTRTTSAPSWRSAKRQFSSAFSDAFFSSLLVDIDCPLVFQAAVLVPLAGSRPPRPGLPEGVPSFLSSPSGVAAAHALPTPFPAQCVLAYASDLNFIGTAARATGLGSASKPRLGMLAVRRSPLSLPAQTPPRHQTNHRVLRAVPRPLDVLLRLDRRRSRLVRSFRPPLPTFLLPSDSCSSPSTGSSTTWNRPSPATDVDLCRAGSTSGTERSRLFVCVDTLLPSLVRFSRPRN